ncbi:hypothetical protein OAO01_00655 [Oligoflexia bacterium]|nr:hypothetical protein [Oligoflexia bacterium]
MSSEKGKEPQQERVCGELSLSISPNSALLKLFLVLVSVELLIALLDITINWGRLIDNYHIRRIVNITHEDSIVTWMSCFLFISVAATFWLLAIRAKQCESIWRRLDWIVLAVLFTYLSLDDGARIHERIGSAFGSHIKDDAVWSSSSSWLQQIGSVFPSYYWHVVYMPIFAFMGLCMFFLLWREFKSPFLRMLLVCGLGCYAVSQGLDFIEGLGDGYEYVEQLFAIKHSTARHFSKVIEEFLEMFGTTLLLVALLKHFTVITGKVSVGFESKAEA